MHCRIKVEFGGGVTRGEQVHALEAVPEIRRGDIQFLCIRNGGHLLKEWALERMEKANAIGFVMCGHCQSGQRLFDVGESFNAEKFLLIFRVPHAGQAGDE